VAPNFTIQTTTGVQLVVAEFTFTPVGATFNEPVTLTLVYDDTGLTAAQEAAMQIFDLTVNPAVPLADSSCNAVTNTCTGTTTHFSNFGVGTGSSGAGSGIVGTSSGGGGGG